MFGLDAITCAGITCAIVVVGVILLFMGAKKINGPS